MHKVIFGNAVIVRSIPCTMGAQVEDVRNYIVIKPIPAWEEAKESKLTARSTEHYTLALPTRKTVFHTNYARRQVTYNHNNNIHKH